MDKKSYLRKKLLSWNYGGQDKAFFKRNADMILQHNAHVTIMFLVVLTSILLGYFLFTLIFMPREMQMVYLYTGIALGGLYFIYKIWGQHSRLVTSVYTQMFFALFSAFLLYIDFTSPDVYAIFLPVFFVFVPLLLLTPLSYILEFIVALFTIVVIGTLQYKPALAYYDIFDVLICMVVGIVIGGGVLHSRVSEIALLSERAESNYDVIQTLAANYFALHVLDLDTGRITIYSLDDSVRSRFGKLLEITDFESAKQLYAEQCILPEDRADYYRVSSVPYIRQQLSELSNYDYRYRVYRDGQEDSFEYCSVRFLMMVGGQANRVLVAHSSIDRSYRKALKDKLDLEAARMSATTDALTGAYNRTAYNESAAALDRFIHGGYPPPSFAILMCDINDLKEVNDTQGHEKGDELICNVHNQLVSFFPHSGVYRIGGDEFAIILRGEDYNARDRLLALLREGGCPVASGMAIFDPERDRSVKAVLDRADEQMYKYKHEYKLGRL